MGAAARWGRRLGRTATAAFLALTVVPGALPASATHTAAPPVDEVRWAEASVIDDFVSAQRDAMRLPALVVGVIVDGDVRYKGAFGDAAPGGPAATTGTAFALGSTSKQFAGLAVQQLIAAGALTADATVRDLIGDMLPPDGGAFADVTVAQLLSHRSGFALNDGLHQWELWPSTTSLDAQTRMLLTLEPAADPGTTYVYSNANYTVIGSIIERLWGGAYAAALDDLVFGPLGLTTTTADVAAERSADFYPWFGLVNAVTPQPAPAAAVPSAFVISTADDLLRLVGAHLGTVATGIPETVLRAAREPIGQAFALSEYASGWGVRPFRELRNPGDARDDEAVPRLWEHTGATQRSMTYLAMQPELGLGVVILSNTAPGLDEARIGVLARRLLHTVVGTQAAPAQVDLLVAAAPSLLIVVPLLLVGVIVWLGVVLRARRAAPARSPSGSATDFPSGSPAHRWIAIGVSGAVIAVRLVLALVIVPSRTEGALWDTWWWTAAPDLAVSMGLVLILAAVGLVLLTGVIRPRRGQHARP